MPLKSVGQATRGAMHDCNILSIRIAPWNWETTTNRKIQSGILDDESKEKEESSD